MRKNNKPFDRLAWVSQKGNKDKSKAQEKRIAKEFGGRVQRGSGNTLGRKGDIDLVSGMDADIGTFKLEAKTTKHASYGLKLSELQKIEKEAILSGRFGGMIITFHDSPEHDYIVVRKDFLYRGGDESDKH